MRLTALLILLAGAASTAIGQTAGSDDFKARYEEFRKKAKSDYADFRTEANRRYAKFMREAWENYNALPVLTKPKEDEVPPTVVPDNERDKPIKSEPVPIRDTVVTPPPTPQPAPPAPIRQQPEPPVQQYAGFEFYGTPGKVRFNPDQRFKLADCSAESMARAWERMSDSDYNNTLHDCLKLRDDMRLDDWNYLQLLNSISTACMGGNGNEATALKIYLYCQSGYKVRMGVSGNKLYPLYASQHYIYDVPRFEVDGDMLYAFNCSESNLRICDVPFPKEQPLSLWINRQPKLAHKASAKRKLQSKSHEDVAAEISVNRNLIDLYNDYPTSAVGDDFMTRWAMYANTPPSADIRNELYPALRKCIKDMTEHEGAGRLLNFVQTAFEYEYDDKVWGGDRAFFAEESLYYPYCDCEDRSILFSRLVRDLLGLDVVLVYYPGHLATAVAFAGQVPGDYIVLDGKRYVVCDPTYIGARVGMTMPRMDNATAKVILLRHGR